MINYGNAFKNNVLDGILKAVSAIKSTYGPYGSVVYAKSRYGGKTFTKDGYTVALALEDINNNSESAEDIGINMVVECSKRVNQLCGDSSTGVVVIFGELINQIRNLDLRPYEINDFLSKLEKDADIVIENIKNIAKPVSNIEELKKIGVTSANNKELGELIADLIWQVKWNKVRVDQAPQYTYTEVLDGIQIPANLVSYELANQMVNPVIFITSRTITNPDELSGLLGIAKDSKDKSLCIICEDMLPTVYNVLNAFQEKGYINITVVKMPFSGKLKEDVRSDLAKLTGTRVCGYASEIKDFVEGSEINGEKEEGVTLGSCKLLHIVNGDLNIILNDDAPTKELLSDIEKINPQTDLEKSNKQSRIDIINGRVGALHLYADSESEFKEIRDRVDDSINSCKNSLKYGYLKGGGRGLLEAINNVDNKVLCEALRAPSRNLPEPTDDIIDSAWSMIQCIKVATSMAKIYLKLDYAVVNKIESVFDRS